MIDHPLALELKNAGFPQTKRPDGTTCSFNHGNGYHDCAIVPTLSELVEACGDIRFTMFGGYGDGWWAFKNEHEAGAVNGKGSTPDEAVARLYVALNKKN